MPQINRVGPDEPLNLTCRKCDWAMTVRGYARARSILAGHVGQAHPEVRRGGDSSFSPLPAPGAKRTRPMPRLDDGREHKVTTRRVDPGV